jgi:hypothetical protein
MVADVIDCAFGKERQHGRGGCWTQYNAVHGH